MFTQLIQSLCPHNDLISYVNFTIFHTLIVVSALPETKNLQYKLKLIAKVSTLLEWSSVSQEIIYLLLGVIVIQ